MTQEEKYRIALEEIVNPIKFMRDRLQEDEKLDGNYAVMLSNSANYLRDIAVKALDIDSKPHERKLFNGAVKWNGNNFDELVNFNNQFYGHKRAHEDAEEACKKSGQMPVKTENGTEKALIGDWVVKKEDGSFEVLSEANFIFKYLY